MAIFKMTKNKPRTNKSRTNKLSVKSLQERVDILEQKTRELTAIADLYKRAAVHSLPLDEGKGLYWYGSNGATYIPTMDTEYLVSILRFILRTKRLSLLNAFVPVSDSSRLLQAQIRNLISEARKRGLLHNTIFPE